MQEKYVINVWNINGTFGRSKSHIKYKITDNNVFLT